MKKISKTLVTLVLFLTGIIAFAACGIANEGPYKISFIVDAQEYYVTQTKGKEVIQMPTIPEKDGYTFNGWFFDKDIWNQPFTAEYYNDIALNKDVKVYSKFIQGVAQSYNVNFEAGIDVYIESQEVLFGESFNFEVPNRKGYVFLGWATQEGNLLTNEIGQSSNTWELDEDTTLYGSWEVQTYYITYNLNGGENFVDNIESFTIYNLENEDGTILLQAPSKETKSDVVETIYNAGHYYSNVDVTAYDFDGWYLDSNYDNEVTELSIDLGSVTLYAKWTSDTSRQTADIYKRVNSQGEIKENGDYILYGEYPQTIKEENITITNLQDDRGYFKGSDNLYYAKVVASHQDDYVFSNSERMIEEETYYFKVEPVKWRILYEENGYAMILSQSIIDTSTYYYTGIMHGDIYVNNYEFSTIRHWLNNDFYLTVFNSLQKELATILEVDNSAQSTGNSNNQHASDNTNDKVFLLSYSEVADTELGFANDADRVKTTTDYYRARGGMMDVLQEGYYGNAYWWLRSPSEYANTASYIITERGSYAGYAVNSLIGVVPAVYLKLTLD